MLREFVVERRALLAFGVTLFGEAAARADAARTQTLFVIARSKNTNEVHYDVRLERGKLDLSEPLVAYWVMRAEDGRRESLSWFEEEFAYGFRIASKARPEGFRLRLTAFSQRELSVRRARSGAYRAYLTIAGRNAALQRIFVSTDERGMTPTVRHVDLFGVVPGKNESVSERRRP